MMNVVSIILILFLSIVCKCSQCASNEVASTTPDSDASRKQLDMDLRARLKQMSEKNQQLEQLDNHSNLFEAFLRKMKPEAGILSLSSWERTANEEEMAKRDRLQAAVDQLLNKFRYHNMGK